MTENPHIDKLEIAYRVKRALNEKGFKLDNRFNNDIYHIIGNMITEKILNEYYEPEGYITYVIMRN